MPVVKLKEGKTLPARRSNPLLSQYFGLYRTVGSGKQIEVPDELLPALGDCVEVIGVDQSKAKPKTATTQVQEGVKE